MKKVQTKELPKDMEKELMDLTFENAKLELEVKKQELQNKLESLRSKGIEIIVLKDNCPSCKNKNKPSFFGKK